MSACLITGRWRFDWWFIWAFVPAGNCHYYTIMCVIFCLWCSFKSSCVWTRIFCMHAYSKISFYYSTVRFTSDLFDLFFILIQVDCMAFNAQVITHKKYFQIRAPMKQRWQHNGWGSLSPPWVWRWITGTASQIHIKHAQRYSVWNVGLVLTIACIFFFFLPNPEQQRY